jgi:hypothetical protein
VTKSLQERSKVLEQQLIETYGVLIGGDALRRLLCYQTPSAFRQARKRGTLRVPLVVIPRRKGAFAAAANVAHWLVGLVETAKRPQQKTDCSFQRGG